MKLRSSPVCCGLLALLLADFARAASVSDIVTIEKRRVVIATAQRLTRAPEPAPLPPDLAQPFSPPGFDQPDPEELRAAAAAKSAGQPAPTSGPAGGDQAALQPGDREILETLAAKLPATGTMIFQGEPLLTLGRGSRVRVGDRFTVSDNVRNQEFELELVAIDRTTFTLRYHSAEITRPIKPGKSQ